MFTTPQNGVSCNLTGTAHWDDSGLHTEGENYCATGEDFIGVTWSGSFTAKSHSISGKNQLGGALTIYNSDSTPNAGRVWSFKDSNPTSKYTLYAKDINLNVNISKNTLTGNGNTAEAVLKYIHTYSKVKGSISITLVLKLLLVASPFLIPIGSGHSFALLLISRTKK